MPALGGRSLWWIGGERYSAPAITPWAGGSAIGQWRRRVSIGQALPDSGTAPGGSHHHAGQPADPHQGDDRQGIERDDFSACGGDFYARGHIRAIARAAGADPEPLVQEYDSSH